MLTVGSLFAGIGGFDLGFERAGMRTLWQVEQSEFCRRVLERHFPGARRYEDVRDVTGCVRRWEQQGGTLLEYVDVLCGGFPCQDLSYAGKGAGLEGERSGLWSEYARLIRELRPRYVVVENVSALLGRGLGRVLGDLAEVGYDAEWDCIPASAVGAPHRRDRIWLVAYSNGSGPQGRRLSSRQGQEVSWAGDAGPHPHPNSRRLEVGTELNGEPIEGTADRSSRRRHADGLRYKVADSTRLRRERAGAPWNGRTGSADGGSRERVGDADSAPQDALATGRRPREATSESGWWATEPDVGRVAHGIPSRVDRLSALGNALVPQVAEWIGRRIVQYEEGCIAA